MYKNFLILIKLILQIISLASINKRIKFLFLISAFLGFVEAFFSVLVSIMIIPITAKSLEGVTGYIEVFLKELNLLSNNNQGVLLAILGFALCMKTITYFVNTYIILKSKQLLMMALGVKITSKFSEIDYSSWIEMDHGHEISIYTKQLPRAVSFVSNFFMMLAQIIVILSLLFSAFSMSYSLTFFIIFFALSLYVLAYRPVNVYSNRLGIKAIELISQNTERFRLYLFAWRDLKILNSEKPFTRIVNDGLKAMLANEFKMGIVQVLPRITTDLLIGILVLLVGFVTIESVSLTSNQATLSFFLITGIQILQKFSMFGSTLSKTIMRMPGFQLIINKISVEDCYNLDAKMTSYTPSFEINGNNYFIDTPAISFARLESASLKLKKGGLYYITGDSGSGKTIYCSVLAGLYHKNASLREAKGVPKLTLVPQDPKFYFHSVEKNLNDFNLVEVNKNFVRLCDICNIDQNLFEMNVENLSTGQQARVALVRALLKNPDILIIDETLSNIESTLEAKILQSIRNDQKATTLVVSHRIPDIKNYDGKICIKKGSIYLEKH